MQSQIGKRADEMARKGRLIEAGFLIQVLASAPADLPPWELHMVRAAFFFGAKHMLETMLAAQEMSDEQMLSISENMRKEFDIFAVQYEAMMSKDKPH